MMRKRRMIIGLAVIAVCAATGAVWYYCAHAHRTAGDYLYSLVKECDRIEITYPDQGKPLVVNPIIDRPDLVRAIILSLQDLDFEPICACTGPINLAFMQHGQMVIMVNYMPMPDGYLKFDNPSMEQAIPSKAFERMMQPYLPAQIIRASFDLPVPMSAQR